ncbi:MAG: pyridoxamine 5'-phosphate oxidase family protein [Ferruginibacter sp.]
MIGKLTNEQIDDVLRDNILGCIGCSDGNKTYIVPVSYAFDGNCILAHSVEGMKIEMMRNNPDVCFEVGEIKSFSNWKSVITWGKYQELTDERDRYYAMKIFVDRMIHIKTSKTAILPRMKEKEIHPHLPENVRPVIYRIIITEKTGRFEND